MYCSILFLYFYFQILLFCSLSSFTRFNFFLFSWFDVFVVAECLFSILFNFVFLWLQNTCFLFVLTLTCQFYVPLFYIMCFLCAFILLSSLFCDIFILSLFEYAALPFHQFWFLSPHFINVGLCVVSCTVMWFIIIYFFICGVFYVCFLFSS